MTTTTAFAFAPSESSSSSSLSTNSKSKSFLQRQSSSASRRGLVAVYSAPTSAAATTTASSTEETPPSSSASSFPPANARPVITKITSEEQLTAYLNSNADDVSSDNRVTVIQFHAAWCKSCQKFGRLYHKLAVDNADWERIPPSTSSLGISAATSDSSNESTPSSEIVKYGQVRMASIEWGANAALCRSLDI
jgi:thiol-disulfide isomerase/thioredoxin